MTGQPGRSGGARPGAGRPVETVRLRRGDKWRVRSLTEDGQAIGIAAIATVRIDSKNVVHLDLDNGETIKLVR